MTDIHALVIIITALYVAVLIASVKINKHEEEIKRLKERLEAMQEGGQEE